MLKKGLVGALCTVMVVGPITSSADEPMRISKFFRHKAPEESAVVQFAKTLDEVEKQLNLDGTVVAKAPDIWGEARLTKHRQEFETVLAKEVDNFEFRLNASISRTDQAFLANALSISAISAGTTLNATSNVPNTPALNVNQASNLVPGLAVQTGNGQPATPPTNSVIFQQPPTGLLNGDFLIANKGINIEPEILLDQQARYLNHLNEIRRINEGDDTADSPGYSLNLVRVPVSIMPGTKTRVNHGAEITITATPHVTDELLPVTFRQLVINDLVDLLAPVVRKFAEELPDTTKPLEKQGDAFERLAGFLRGETVPCGPAVLDYYGEDGIAANGGDLLLWLAQRRTAIGAKKNELQRLTNKRSSDAVLEMRNDAELSRVDRMVEAVESAASQPNYEAKAITAGVISTLGQTIYSLAPQILQTNVGSVTRRAREPVSSSDIPFVFGVHELISLGYDFRQRTKPGQMIHLADVRSYLHEELESAFDLVNRPGSIGGSMLSDPATVLADSYSENSLLDRIRNVTHDNVRSVFDDRVRVSNQFSRTLKIQLKDDEELEMHLPSVTTSLAWAVVAESILLNKRLNEDIQNVSMDPECGCNCAGEMIFCGPNPAPQARAVFADYVKCRWPIHVFALDPQSQDQNVADSFSMRREMQLAMALSFASGRMSAQNMTRYVRRLEMDMETIALNRTTAAFGHGKDVFGWRFYPRVQTPPFESTTTTVFRDMLRGGPNKDDVRRSWEIEPGMRECTAVVLMPSFITHVTFDVRGNYFPMGRHKLHEPSDTRTSIEENMEMSHKIRLMENAACSITAEANCYRDGETQRLLRRADQVAKKLPLQTVHARVPNENTMGGFEMFSSGITDMAPELLDFYGMPGVDPSGDTVLYLVGENFSVHETRVLAGNRDINFSLISRQLMQVTIPAGVEMVDNLKCVAGEKKCEQPAKIVNVHVSTPYGVSQPLELPVVESEPAFGVAGYRWSRENLKATYRIPVDSVAKTVDTSLQQFNATNAKTLMDGPYVLEVNVPPGQFPHQSTADIEIVITSPELGLSVTVRPAAADKAQYNAKYDAQVGVYRIKAAEFVKVHNDIRESFAAMLNDAMRNQPKVGGSYEIQLKATILPASASSAIPLENTLTLNVDVVPLEAAAP